MLTDEQTDVLRVLGLEPSAASVSPRPGCSVWSMPAGDEIGDLVVKHLEAWLLVTPFGGVSMALQCMSCKGRDLYLLSAEPALALCSTCGERTQHRHVAPDGRVWGA